VRASNRGALALYEKLHFTRRATRRHYYSDGEDAIVMGKELT
jgi:ribosomal protein S18 acetylase RimI-like enzyme